MLVCWTCFFLMVRYVAKNIIVSYNIHNTTSQGIIKYAKLDFLFGRKCACTRHAYLRVCVCVWLKTASIL